MTPSVTVNGILLFTTGGLLAINVVYTRVRAAHCERAPSSVQLGLSGLSFYRLYSLTLSDIQKALYRLH